MIGTEDEFTYEYEDYYKILPSINGWANTEERIKGEAGTRCIYSSETNSDWMTRDTLISWLTDNKDSWDQYSNSLAI